MFRRIIINRICAHGAPAASRRRGAGLGGVRVVGGLGVEANSEAWLDRQGPPASADCALPTRAVAALSASASRRAKLGGGVLTGTERVLVPVLEISVPSVSRAVIGVGVSVLSVSRAGVSVPAAVIGGVSVGALPGAKLQRVSVVPDLVGRLGLLVSVSRPQGF